MVNWEKSHLSPAQQVTYLGFVVNLQAIKLFLLPSKLTQVLECCRETLEPVREIAKVRGGNPISNLASNTTGPLVLLQSSEFGSQVSQVFHLVRNPGYITRQDLEW